jgi:hypothetical protein
LGIAAAMVAALAASCPTAAGLQRFVAGLAGAAEGSVPDADGQLADLRPHDG